MKSVARGGQKTEVEGTKISRSLASVPFGGRKALEKAAQVSSVPAEFNNNTSLQLIGGSGGHSWRIVGGDEKSREETVRALQRNEIGKLIKRKVNLSVN